MLRQRVRYIQFCNGKWFPFSPLFVIDCLCSVLSLCPWKPQHFRKPREFPQPFTCLHAQNCRKRKNVGKKILRLSTLSLFFNKCKNGQDVKPKMSNTDVQFVTDLAQSYRFIFFILICVQSPTILLETHVAFC